MNGVLASGPIFILVVFKQYQRGLLGFAASTTAGQGNYSKRVLKALKALDNRRLPLIKAEHND